MIHYWCFMNNINHDDYDYAVFILIHDYQLLVSHDSFITNHCDLFSKSCRFSQNSLDGQVTGACERPWGLAALRCWTTRSPMRSSGRSSLDDAAV